MTGLKLEAPIRAILSQQKEKLHNKNQDGAGHQGNMLSAIFEKFVMLMVVYFVVSILNSLAASYSKRKNSKPAEKK